MSAFKKMTDMARSPEETSRMNAPVLAEGPYYPSGLCLTLTEKDLEKLDLEADCEPGDLLHMMVMGKVTSISKSDDCCSISMQIVGMSVEDEATEPVSKMTNRYGVADDEEASE